MRIVSITMVRNEADIVEAFARHHLDVVDHMIFVDHRSIDSTSAILQSLVEEGAPIEIFREKRLEFPQAEVTTEHMHRAARKLGADWVLLLDADEFVASDRGPELRARFEHLPSDNVHLIPWRCYVPRAGDDANEGNVLERIQHRRSVEPRPVGKLLVPGCVAEDPSTYVDVGNHSVRRKGRRHSVRRKGRRSKRIPRHIVEDLFLAHFPVRSIEQLTSKVLVGWPSRLASPEQTRGGADYFRIMFGELVQGYEFSAENLERAAAVYAASEEAGVEACELVHAPVASPNGPIALRYSSGHCEVAPVLALAELAEDLGYQLSRERRRSVWARVSRRLRDERERRLPERSPRRRESS